MKASDQLPTPSPSSAPLVSKETIDIEQLQQEIKSLQAEKEKQLAVQGLAMPEGFDDLVLNDDIAKKLYQRRTTFNETCYALMSKVIVCDEQYQAIELKDEEEFNNLYSIVDECEDDLSFYEQQYFSTRSMYLLMAQKVILEAIDELEQAWNKDLKSHKRLPLSEKRIKEVNELVEKSVQAFYPAALMMIQLFMDEPNHRVDGDLHFTDRDLDVWLDTFEKRVKSILDFIKPGSPESKDEGAPRPPFDLIKIRASMPQKKVSTSSSDAQLQAARREEAQRVVVASFLHFRKELKGLQQEYEGIEQKLSALKKSTTQLLSGNLSQLKSQAEVLRGKALKARANTVFARVGMLRGLLKSLSNESFGKLRDLQGELENEKLKLRETEMSFMRELAARRAAQQATPASRTAPVEKKIKEKVEKKPQRKLQLH